MFGTYAYYNITRSITAVFGSLFNDIDVVRKDQSGNVLNQERVPIAYGPRQKWLARLEEREDLDDTKVALKLPRLSFELVGINYDSSRQLNKNCKDKLTSVGGDPNKKAAFATGAPYVLNFELNIYSKTHDDNLQIMEQILPNFKPSYSVTIKPISSQPTITQDVKFKLNSVTPNHTYEGVFTERNVYIYTLNFDVTTMYYGPISDSDVIKTAIANIYEYDNPTNLIVGTTYAVNPSTAEEDDVYTIDITQEFGFDNT